MKTAALALTATLYATAAMAGSGPLTVEEAVSVKNAGSVVISPDGERIAYVLSEPRTADEDNGRSYNSIWMLKRGETVGRRFTRKTIGAGSPSFTPDSQKLLFTSKRGSNNQVWWIPVDGGEAQEITEDKSGVMGYRLSPDGSQIAYTTLAAEDATKKKARDKGFDAEVVDTDHRHHVLKVVTIASGATVTVTPETSTAFEMDWSPDGKQLAVMWAKTPGNDDNYMFRTLSVVNADGKGEPRKLASDMGKMGHVRWSPDGKTIAWLGAADLNEGTTGTIWTVPAAGGTPTALNKGAEETAYDIDWLPGGDLLVCAVTGTRSHLTQRTLKGKAKKLYSGAIFLAASVDSAGKSVALSASTGSHPNEVFVGKLNGIKRATDHNPWLKTKTLGKQTAIEWKAKDGTRIEGVLVMPTDLKKGTRAPLAVMVHGGPEWQSLDGWGTRYLSPAQVLAGQGYVCLFPNYRGSSGRGAAFSKADHNDLGGKEFQDILDGIDKLDADGLIDPKRVAMMGGSYGGYMSALAATKGSKRYAAAINFAGIFSWWSFMGTSDIPHEMALVHWNQYCTDGPEASKACHEASPLAWMDNAKTPALIIHGKEDKRVPLGQAWEMYTAFKLKKVPTELVLYPREGHGLAERSHQIDCMNRIIGWLNRWLAVTPVS